MATTYGTNAGKVINGTGTPGQALVAGNVHSFTEVVTLASQAAADITYVARIPKGAVFLRGWLTSTVTLGSTTISIGVVGTAAKYMASGTFTTADVPAVFGKAAASGVALTANDDVIITWATATAPASGSLVVVIEYAFD